MKKLFFLNAMLLVATSVFAANGMMSPNTTTNSRCTATYTLTVIDGDGNVVGNYMAVSTGSTCASAMHSAKGMAYTEAYTAIHY